MTDSRKFPEIKGFNIGMKNIPHYPREVLDELAADLQAAEIFVNSNEGAEALGLDPPIPTPPQDPHLETSMALLPPGIQAQARENVRRPEQSKLWETLDLHQKVAVANALAQRRFGSQQAAPQLGVQAANAPTKPMTMPQKMEKMLEILYEASQAGTVEVEQDQELADDMKAAGLDPSQMEIILERMSAEGWVRFLTGGGTFQLTPAGAREKESLG